MKILNSEIVLVEGKCRDGAVKEEISNEKGKKLKPHKQENKDTPRPHTLSYYKLSPGKYLVKKSVFLKNGSWGILYESLEISEDCVKIEITKCEGKLPIQYLQHISAP